MTTYRRISLAALERLRPELGLPRFDRRPEPLPGAHGLEEAGRGIARDFPELDPATRSHLLHLYGSLAEDVLAPASDDAALLEPIHPDAPDVLAQIGYAGEQEWAVSVDDVVWRGRRSVIAAWPMPPPRGWRSGSRTRRRRERRGLGPVLGRAVISPGRSRVSSRSWRTRAHRCPSSLVQSHSGAT